MHRTLAPHVQLLFAACAFIPLLGCTRAGARSREAAPPSQSADARRAATRGLGYLARSATAWTDQHHCYGCHVQAVTLEGFAVGMHNQYPIPKQDLATMVAAMRLGVTAGGRRTGAAFQGAAWARYDQWISGDQEEQLER